VTSGTGATIKIEEINPVKKKISVEIPWEEVKRELDAAYRTVGKKARVKGFRPGKTPRHILETYFREDAEGEAVSNLVQRSFEEAVQANSLQPVARPEIDQSGIQPEKSFTYSATLEVEPVVEPRGYIGMELRREDASVTDRDVEERLEELRHMYSSLEDVEGDRPVQNGDFLLIDFEGKLGSEPRKELTETGFRIEVGSKRLVPGFEDALVGMRKGESKEFTVRFPEDYHIRDFASQDITFHATVRDVRVKVLPALDDQFIKNFERYESLEALRADLRKSLEEEKSVRARDALRKAVNDRLLEANPFEVPEAFIERQILDDDRIPASHGDQRDGSRQCGEGGREFARPVPGRSRPPRPGGHPPAEDRGKGSHRRRRRGCRRAAARNCRASRAGLRDREGVARDR